MPDPLRHIAEVSRAQSLRQYQEMREAQRQENEKRIHAQLVPYRIPVYVRVPILERNAPNEVSVVGFKKRLHHYIETGFKVLPEVHSMEEMYDAKSPLDVATTQSPNAATFATIEAKLASSAHGALLMSHVTIPGGEEYDGPALYSLNEDEILECVDKLHKKVESMADETHQSELRGEEKITPGSGEIIPPPRRRDRMP